MSEFENDRPMQLKLKINLQATQIKTCKTLLKFTLFPSFTYFYMPLQDDFTQFILFLKQCIKDKNPSDQIMEISD